MLHTNSPLYPEVFHRKLADFNETRLAVGKPSAAWQASLALEFDMRDIEGQYLEILRQAVSGLLPSSNCTASEFIHWFESLVDHGPGQNHPLFDWLETEADAIEVRWYLMQEAAGEAGFDDLVAYAQVKLPMQAKLECARNYWDEMGHGKAGAVHGLMLDRMVQELGLTPSRDDTVWESLALSNTMVGLATTRRYAYQALGALGAIELTAPGRVKKVSAAMRRVGMSAATRAYFDLHAALDISHGRAWVSEVIGSLVAIDPSCQPFLAEGALMRLMCGNRCFDRYAAAFRAGDGELPNRVDVVDDEQWARSAC